MRPHAAAFILIFLKKVLSVNYLTIDLLSVLTISVSITELSAKPECSLIHALNQVAFKKPLDRI
jgi:hypothetical protein